MSDLFWAFWVSLAFLASFVAGALVALLLEVLT
jgi:hypothetical protein